MGDMLLELERVLRSKPSQDKMTQREQLVLEACKARAVRGFTFTALASSAVAWIATRSLSHGQRFSTSVGSAFAAGVWKFNRTLNSCVDQILELEGSRMQRELAEIILAKHPNNASRLKLVRKHFYGEQVFNDSNPDKPLFRWRYRNFYVDENSTPQMSEDVEDSISHEKQPNMQLRKQSAKSVGGAGDITADPLDCIFGEGEASREIDHPDSSGPMSRRRQRAHKRAHRRHRAHRADTNPDELE